MFLCLIPAWPSYSQDVEERLREARRQMSMQRLDKAMREVDKVLEADPGQIDALLLKGEIALRLGDLDAALASWTDASRLQPGNVDLMMMIGDLLIRKPDRLDDALAVFGRILEGDPANVRIMVSKGSIHERRGQWQEAAALYRSALAVDPNYVRARSNLGAVLFKMGRYEEAGVELQKAIELSPHDLRSLVFSGLAQNHLGRYESALTQLKEAVRVDPHSANHLIGVKEQHAQFLLLAEKFQKAWEAAPREAGRSYDLAVIHYYAQDYEAAWRELTRAEKLRYPVPIEFKEVVYSRRKLRAS
ncbi:MAG: tetratricopeptide repeat protein [Candidatus Polarisedimenticolia bacterium]